MLQVKPLLHFVDTKIVPYDKVRTKKRAMKRIEEQLAQEVEGSKTYLLLLLKETIKKLHFPGKRKLKNNSLMHKLL